MVAESVQETPTLTPETPVESQVDETVVTPPAGDAGEPSAVDAAGANDAAQAEAESSFSSFEEYEQSRQSKESGGPAPEAEQERETTQQPLVDPQAYAQARNTYAQAVQRVQTTVGDLEKELVSDYGIPEATAKRIAKDMHDRVNELHAHGLNFYGMEAATKAEQRAATQFNQMLQQGLEKGLPKPLQTDFTKWLGEAQKQSEQGIVTHDAWIGKVVELARKGYVTETQAKAERQDAFNAGRGAKEKAGEADGASSGSNVRGSAGSRDNRNDDAKLMDPNTPVSEIEAILARRGM